MFKKIFIQKLIPLVIAVFTGLYFFQDIAGQENEKTKDVENEIKKIYHLANYNQNHSVETVVSALKSENTIFLIGSSELGTEATRIAARPDLFFQKYQTPLSVVMLGHDGNQCMSVYAQFLALNKYLKNSKISIIVSPGWFEGHFAYGTSLDRFLEYNNESFINKIFSDNEIPGYFKDYVAEYIYEKRNDFVSPSVLYKKIICEYKSKMNIANRPAMYPLLRFYDLQKIPEKDLVNKKMIIVYDKKHTAETFINWDSLFTEAVNYQKSISTNNNWGIYNEYFTNYVIGKAGKEEIYDIDDIVELKDFEMILKLFKYYNADASFIIQPINPYAYKNLKDYKPVINSIEKLINDYNYPYINMFVYDTSDYRTGILTDVMHFGEYGWLLADKFLIDTYEKQ